MSDKRTTEALLGGLFGTGGEEHISSRVALTTLAVYLGADSKTVRELLSALSAAEEERAELLKDRARLDWLDANPCDLLASFFKDSSHLAVRDGYSDILCGDTVREAIDAAMGGALTQETIDSLLGADSPELSEADRTWAEETAKLLRRFIDPW